MDAEPVQALLDRTFREEGPRLRATLIRLLGDFDIAEDGLQEAFAAAARQWPSEGIPDNPRSWLISTGRFKGIDSLRKLARIDSSLKALEETLHAPLPLADVLEPVSDDHLRLIFICCHPALRQESRVALTLREVCGLTTEEIARSFLTSPPTIAQRIVRAKTRIRELNLPYEVPGTPELPERLDSVLQVIYLVFNEGYSASSGKDLIRNELVDEAIRLGRLMSGLMPEAECIGLLALMLLQDARRAARVDEGGELILLEDQDRTRWNRAQIEEGLRWVEKALTSPRAGSYSIQAAIAAVHCEASSYEATDWPQITALYKLLQDRHPSPIVELNLAIAIAMRDGPSAGLALIDSLLERGELRLYRFAHSARGEMLRRLGRMGESLGEFEVALNLVEQPAERRFLERRIAEVKQEIDKESRNGVE